MTARTPVPFALDAAAPTLAAWLDAHAETIDTTQDLAADILPRLGAADLLRIGVPAQYGGAGGSTVDAIEAIAAVARRSLAAAFVFWGQRAFIEYLLQSPNGALRERWLPALVAGERAGATGLSNAMKYLSNIEPLQMSATPVEGAAARWTLNGQLPWITNLRREGFIVAAAFDNADGRAPSIFAVPHDANGVSRSDDLDLIALRSSNTAALRLDGTVLDADWLIAADAAAFLAHARPAFLGLQCGMSIGLARRALEAAAASSPPVRAATGDEAAGLARELDALTQRLYEGIDSGAFVSAPASQFGVRIGLASIVGAASQLEVQAAGGRGYLRGTGGVARRAREAAFVPIVTPSIVQLKNQLAQHSSSRQTNAA
ncbi:acyl-CoA dehydrogenase family protein [Paraburkholderia caballeronis]|uniref:acyl-CoA dehydrogenase family protein n=1 Tax=Paraburkholderia caballeronis TaxID=416943 RepID=UPI00106535DC|nr:acyl-CoA dehydrogenase family protein [Paraburkholderia caballeronis]TDV16467.1 alkylation response protein AidB-like acyl-CoA dehydrogenase [Paraburkholderia caballeronis]TDV18863.1 alkylation response protein AidB-like acyl-CoA dehydrogenase [Paraburkholderia caballeronis]TDV26996.1 alkylation response protein AidB-like acyl-CoA dehydrogenase [Paraburkholderia caballeronis]